MSTIRPGRYQLTATRGQDEVLRQGFDNLDEAHQAAREALMRYPDCEIRLTSGGVVLITAAPARSS